MARGLMSGFGNMWMYVRVPFLIVGRGVVVPCCELVVTHGRTWHDLGGEFMEG